MAVWVGGLRIESHGEGLQKLPANVCTSKIFLGPLKTDIPGLILIRFSRINSLGKEGKPMVQCIFNILSGLSAGRRRRNSTLRH